MNEPQLKGILKQPLNMLKTISKKQGIFFSQKVFFVKTTKKIFHSWRYLANKERKPESNASEDFDSSSLSLSLTHYLSLSLPLSPYPSSFVSVAIQVGGKYYLT